MTIIKGIDHVQISAKKGSEDKVRKFYVEILGFKEIQKPEILRSRGGLWLDCGNMQMHVGMDDDPDNSNSKRHVAFSVDNLAEIRMVLEKANVVIEEDKAPLKGLTRFYCRDTVGNRVEFLQYN